MSARLAFVAIALIVAGAGRAAAQPIPAAPDSRAPGFLTRSELGVSFARMASGDPRFAWDARFAADVDIAAYRGGRLNLSGEYEGVLGTERRELDLNHENFNLEVGPTYWVGHTELSTVFHHVSRHLTDRENDRTVAWNALGIRAARSLTTGRTSWHGGVEWFRVIQRTFVDYAWMTRIVVEGERPLAGRTHLVLGASGGLVGIDPTRSDRERQCGARVKAGVSIDGRRGAVELYAAYERRVDGYPLALTRSRWFEFGFTLHGR